MSQMSEDFSQEQLTSNILESNINQYFEYNLVEDDTRIDQDEDRNLKDIIKFFLNNKMSSVKKDYLLISLLRSISRSFRNREKNQVPNTTNIRIDPKNTLQNICWHNLVKIFLDDPESFKQFSKSLPKNFNNTYFKDVFSNKSLLKSFFAIIDLLSVDRNPGKLSKTFNIRCCKNEGKHTQVCDQKWTDLIQGLKSLKSLISLCEI